MTATTHATATPRPHQIDLVRPGAASLAWLHSTVAALQAHDPLAPVTLVAPGPYVAWALRRALAEHGCANVRTTI